MKNIPKNAHPELRRKIPMQNFKRKKKMLYNIIL